jgi:hypothetical protein
MKVGDKLFMVGYRKDRRFRTGVRYTGNKDDKLPYTVTSIVTGPDRPIAPVALSKETP